MADAGLAVALRQAAPIPLDVSFTCAAGELLALVGPSGSGKTTILRMIAGLMQPLTGLIRCNDAVWFDGSTFAPPRQRRVGLVFQNYALFPHLTALANVMEAVPATAGRARAQIAADWLRRVHLAGFEHRLPRELSGGQQQRVAVARALAGRPSVLLLDEPFSAIDRMTRESLYEELAELRQQLDMPAILVTHDLDEAALLADRMCLLARGRTLQIGAPGEVMMRPATIEVGRLLGMKNVFEATVISHQHDATVIDWRGRELRVRVQPHYAPGARVAWAIPSAAVLLPSETARGRALDNSIASIVVQVLALGERLRLVCRVEGTDAQLHTTVARHVAGRYSLTPGAALSLRLRGDHIHLMPPADAAPHEP
jgi:molybdate transport system ATP-binding protein